MPCAAEGEQLEASGCVLKGHEHVRLLEQFERERHDLDQGEHVEDQGQRQEMRNGYVLTQSQWTPSPCHLFQQP